MFRRMARAIPGFYLLLVLLFLYLPIFVVVGYSFNQQPKGLMWTGFTTQWYPALLQNRQIMEAFRNSLIVGGWSCALAAVIGTLGAIGLSRRRLRGWAALESLATLPAMVPEVVLGLAFMVAFAFVGLPGSLVSLVLAHTTFCIPYILLIVRSRLAALDPACEEAARDLGANAAQAFFTVTLPLIAPAVLAGVLLAFAMSLDDVIISYFVSGAQSTTFPVYVYSKLKTDVPPTINAMCTLTLGVTFIAVALSRTIQGRKPRDFH